MPLIEVYIQEFKKCEQSLNGGLLKKKLFDEALIYSKNINANADGIVKCNSMGEITFDLSTFDSDKNSCKQPVKCKHCGNTQTLKWHDDSAVKKEASSDNIVDAGKIEHENGKVCHKCHVRLVNNQSLQEEKLPQLLTATSAPLDGSHFGIANLNDTIANYNNGPTSERPTARISLSDILS
ncbi:unnamed protein product [[Candida] boidinii]|nr:unnamed protein product [[Candida] boidinii]